MCQDESVTKQYEKRPTEGDFEYFGRNRDNSYQILGYKGEFPWVG